MAQVLTFGCRLNAYESEVIRGHLAGAQADGTDRRQHLRGHRGGRAPGPPGDPPGPARAARTPPSSRPAARRRSIPRPGPPCRRSTAWSAMPRSSRPQTWQARRPRNASASTTSWRSRRPPRHLVAGFDERVRAFVQIQNGCDHRCTFCIIPYGRGPSRSVAGGRGRRRGPRAGRARHREIVLTGVDITAWGADLPGRPTLGDLVAAHARAGAGAAAPAASPRWTSPRSTRRLYRAIAEEPRLMPHLHLSLQAGDRDDPEAHEAAPSAGAGGRVLRGCAPAAARHGVRRRPDRRLPDRDRGHVRQHAGPCRRLRPHLSPRLPLFGAAGHARPRACPRSTRPCARSAPSACARPATPARGRVPRRRASGDRRRAGREPRQRPQRALRPGRHGRRHRAPGACWR